jgi:hypothetical protein
MAFKDKAVCLFEMSGNINPVTQLHSPEGMNLQIFESFGGKCNHLMIYKHKKLPLFEQ